MSIIEQKGYLEQSYLDQYPYLSGQIKDGIGNQVFMINRVEEAIGLQVELNIDKLELLGIQSELIIDALYKLGNQVSITINKTDAIGTQIYGLVETLPKIGTQVELKINTMSSLAIQTLMKIEDQLSSVGVETTMIVNQLDGLGNQIEMKVNKEYTLGLQALMHIIDKEFPLGIQTEQQIFDDRKIGLEIKVFPLPHYICPKYLVNDYLTDSYLSGCMYATQAVQAKMRIYINTPVGVQVEQRIDTEKSIGVQSEMRVDTTTPLGIQIDRVYVANIGTQINLLIYNITQLRLLCDFASRGTANLNGQNWTSIQPIKAGDFSPNNLNTDLLEQRTQTDGVTTLWELRCDTGITQGAFVDTAAILEHNFTKSAVVTMQGSQDSNFSSIGFNEILNTQLDNIYYIAPELPTQSFRYWRFIIEDGTNPDSDLFIGAIIFGSASIFTTRECFENPVKFGKVHYKDSVKTEGYTNVSNDRATRKFLGLSFSELLLDGGNYKTLQSYFSNSKTDLKCLIIPTPYRPEVLAVFAKLTELPQESHRAITSDEHYISLDLNWDESL